MDTLPKPSLPGLFHCYWQQNKSSKEGMEQIFDHYLDEYLGHSGREMDPSIT